MGLRNFDYLYSFKLGLLQFFKCQCFQRRPFRWRKQAATEEKERALSQGLEASFLYALIIFTLYQSPYTAFWLLNGGSSRKPYVGLMHFGYLYRFTTWNVTIFANFGVVEEGHSDGESKQAQEKEKENSANNNRLASFTHLLYLHHMNSHTLHTNFSMKVVLPKLYMGLKHFYCLYSFNTWIFTIF